MAAGKSDTLFQELKRKRICRFCLCQNNSKLKSIYIRDNGTESSAPLTIQIMAITSIEVFSNDEMPSFVCSDCEDIFEYSYQFKQMCKMADNLLRRFPLTGLWPENLAKPILKASLQSRTILEDAAKINAKTTEVFAPKTSSVEIVLKMEKLDHDDCALTLPSSISEAKFTMTEVIIPDISPKVETITEMDSFYQDDSSFSLATEKIHDEFVNMEAYEDEPDTSKVSPIETNIFPCIHCDRTFPLLQQRDMHLKNHSRDRKFPCEHCKKSFFSKYDLNRHSFTHSSEKPYKCTACDKAFSRSSLLTRHEKTHTDVPKFICVHCERSFISKDDMEKHAVRHNINRPFVCKICNKGFAFKQGLERHEAIHLRQQPYSCQYCELSFSTSTKLARHLTVHASQKKYSCKFCRKSYLYSYHLSRHLRSHRNIDDPANPIQFSCITCDASFNSRDELVRHSADHANEVSLTCPLCKEIFENMSALTSHIEEHSEGEAYACEFCDLIFMTAEKLQSHTDTYHIQEMEAYLTNPKLAHTVEMDANDGNNLCEKPSETNNFFGQKIKIEKDIRNEGNEIDDNRLLVPLKRQNINERNKRNHIQN